jgi:hypothetical protein
MRRVTEFEIQAEIYVLLKSALPNLSVRGEFKLDNADGRGARFDIAILNADETELLMVIEVKKPRRFSPIKPKGHSQSIRYHKLTGLAPMVISEILPIASLLNQISEHVFKHGSTKLTL